MNNKEGGKTPRMTRKRKGEKVSYIYLKDGLLLKMEEVVELGEMKRYSGPSPGWRGSGI